MLKTHEKSRIRPVRGTNAVNNIKEIIIQLETTERTSDGNMVYLVETVDPEDYDRKTAEGRAAEKPAGRNRSQQNRNGRSRSKDRSTGRIIGRSKGHARRNEKSAGKNIE